MLCGIPFIAIIIVLQAHRSKEWEEERKTARAELEWLDHKSQFIATENNIVHNSA